MPTLLCIVDQGVLLGMAILLLGMRDHVMILETIVVDICLHLRDEHSIYTSATTYLRLALCI